MTQQLKIINNDSTIPGPPHHAVVIVTPYSTGCCVASDMKARGYKLICVWSRGFSETMKTHVPFSCAQLSYDAVVDEALSIQATANAIEAIAAASGWRIVAVVCGGEAGVDTADALSEQMGLPSNGTNVANRRDKKVQQELAKAAGLRSVRQAAGRQLADVEAFLNEESYPLIVKPLDSAGSDGVKLVRSYQEAAAHVTALLGSAMINGGICEEVLCQEFLQGKEYVVDHVSRDGVHKTVMVWCYDKRSVNGADFVYFGDIPIDPGSEEAQLLIPYTRGVLDSLGVKYGPSHAEVIMTANGPCLVEMNVRAHGGDGNWRPLCQAMTGGYDQVSATVDAYLDPEAFRQIPDQPPSPLLASGQCVDLVSYKAGKVKSTPGYSVMQLLPSFVCLETHIEAGDDVKKTIDISTDAGSLVLMNTDAEVLARDINIVRQMEKSCALFEFEDEWEDKKRQFLMKATSLDFRPTNAGGHMTHRRIFSQKTGFNNVFEGI
jgi:biotin carboxylase